MAPGAVRVEEGRRTSRADLRPVVLGALLGLLVGITEWIDGIGGIVGEPALRDSFCGHDSSRASGSSHCGDPGGAI